MSSDDNVTSYLKRMINNDSLAITLLLPQGKWRLQALGLVSYQAGSHVTFRIHLMQGIALFDNRLLQTLAGMHTEMASLIASQKTPHSHISS